MKTNDFFSINRFGLLCRQYLIQNATTILISLGGLVIGIFVLLVSIEYFTRFKPWSFNSFFVLLFQHFAIVGVIYAGNSFPGLRSKEKSYRYLLTPNSIAEKFLFEIVTRVILFFILFPLFYLLIFWLHGKFVQLLNPQFHFRFYSLLEIMSELKKSGDWLGVLMIAMSLLFLSVPFTGAAIFMKQPLLKISALAVFIIFLHYLLLFIFFRTTISPLADRQLGYKIYSCYFFAVSAFMITLAYFRLKRREA